MIEAVTAALKKRGGVLEREAFDALVIQQRRSLFEDAHTLTELMMASGLPIAVYRHEVCLLTQARPWRDESFCIVDIETNGSNPAHAQIIEIGALKICHGEVTERFESFVACKYLPEAISELTGIDADDLVGAPPLSSVLQQFRLFLNGSVFVAHNVSFDYRFISESMERCGLGVLGNRNLCTIELAKRTIEAEKYGLGHLNVVLDINTALHHRAYSDALTASKILQLVFARIPESIQTTEQLIDFSKMPVREAKKLLAKRGKPSVGTDEAV